MGTHVRMRPFQISNGIIIIKPTESSTRYTQRKKKNKEILNGQRQRQRQRDEQIVSGRERESGRDNVRSTQKGHQMKLKTQRWKINE